MADTTFALSDTYLLEGAVDMVVDEGDGERVVELQGRSAVLVPAGAWHRAIVHEPGDVLHITRGHATQHRAVEPKEGSDHGK